MDTHENIKMLREQMGLSQEELALKVGYRDRSSVAKVETGNVDLTQSKIAAFAKALHVTPAQLMGIDDNTNIDEAGSELLNLDAQLNATGHIELVNYAEFLVSQPEYRRENGSVSQKIFHYLTPAAAGYASPVEGEDYEILELSDIPPGADYCITVSGDSMEPYIKDGSLVFVKRNAPLAEFDVGVFYVDGDILIKQFAEDTMRNVYLLSANPKRADANRVIFHNANSAFMYYGKVLISKLPRPNYI